MVIKMVLANVVFPQGLIAANRHIAG